jgi:hypothetical protein
MTRDLCVVMIAWFIWDFVSFIIWPFVTDSIQSLFVSFLVGRSEDQIPVYVTLSAPVHTGLLYNGHRVSFSEESAREIKLYPYSLLGLHGLFQGEFYFYLCFVSTKAYLLFKVITAYLYWFSVCTRSSDHTSNGVLFCLRKIRNNLHT